MTATHGHGQPHPPVRHTDSSTLGIVSLILGILSITMFSIFTGIPAIITGIIGLKQPESKGMSIAGIIMGGFSVLIAIVAIIFFVFILLIAASQSSYDTPHSESTPDYHYEDSYSDNYQQRT